MSSSLRRSADTNEGPISDQIERMTERRGRDNPLELCAGPGRLCQALAINGEHDGLSLDRPPFELLAREAEPAQYPALVKQALAADSPAARTARAAAVAGETWEARVDDRCNGTSHESRRGV